MSKKKRSDNSSRLQHAAIANQGAVAANYAPDNWRQLLYVLIRKGPELTRGFAADFIAALSGIAVHKRWPSMDDSGRVIAEPVPCLPAFVPGEQLHFEYVKKEG